jgi:hypothetical protein
MLDLRPTGTERSVPPPSPPFLMPCHRISFIRKIPRLTAVLVRKYPPLSLSSSLITLTESTLRQGTLRQGMTERAEGEEKIIASTRKFPSPSALTSSTFSRRDRIRSAFLDHFDDQDVERSDEPSLPPSFPSPLVRRSSRLALPTSDYSLTRTVHRSEWTASDLNGRFPVPSSNGDDYILITLHLGFIHYIPLKSRTAASYVSAFQQIFAFFKSRSFPVTHFILDNESSFDFSHYLSSFYLRRLLICTPLPTSH